MPRSHAPGATGSDYLLDTNVLIELARDSARGRSINNTRDLSRHPWRCAISIVTVGELYSFALQREWGDRRRKEFTNLLRQLVWIDIHHDDVLDRYAAIDHASRRAGRAMGKNDVWIAATAAASGMILLTGDRDFDHLAPEQLSVEIV